LSKSKQMTVELQDHKSRNQIVTVWIDDETTIQVPIYVHHNGEEVTRVECDVPIDKEPLSSEIAVSILDEVYKSFEPEPEEDDPDRLYERKYDK